MYCKTTSELKEIIDINYYYCHAVRTSMIFRAQWWRHWCSSDYTMGTVVLLINMVSINSLVSDNVYACMAQE